MKITIRKAQIHDLKKCLEINYHAWTVDFKGFAYSEPTPFQTLPETSLVVLDDNQVVGYATWYYDEQGAFIPMFYIDKDHRRKGIGNRLLHAIIEEVRPHKIRLYSHVRNDIATKFYKRNKFIIKRELIFREMPVYEMAL